MTDQSITRFPRFYMTAPAECPYLPGQQERKVFTYLAGEMADALNDALSHMGFRRSQSIAYKPSCEGCSACVSVRIRAGEFHWTKGFRRIAKRNADVIGQAVPARATPEQFSVLRDYLESRHADGGMADMGLFDYAAMVEDSPVDTRLVEYRDRASRELLGVVLTDELSDGLSMVYSFFRPDLEARSFGTFMVLEHVERSFGMGLDYVYLGYWIEGCRKMSYKRRFQPLEALGRGGWHLMEPEAALPTTAAPSPIKFDPGRL